MHDRLNGLARRELIDDLDKPVKEVIYKDDMLIQIADGKLTAVNKAYFAFAPVATASFFLGLFTLRGVTAVNIYSK